jgi:hypothetical protein
VAGGWWLVNSVWRYKMDICTAWGTWCLLLVISITGAGQNISPSVDLKQDQEGMPGELYWSKVIPIGHDVSLPVTINVTAKGNGTLIVGDSSLGKVSDDHDDGLTFDGYLADITFKDINGDGFKDVVVSGIHNIRDDKLYEVLVRKAFVRIYMYNSKLQSFETVFDSNGQKD